MKEQGGPRWCAIGTSVRGAAHERAGAPNQDAVGWSPEQDSESPLVLAVADGHGSAKCFRSEIGAKLAVRAAVEELGSASIHALNCPSLSSAKRVAEDKWPLSLANGWAELVRADLDGRPSVNDELDPLAGARAGRARALVGDNPLLPYGSTLLAVVVTRAFVVYIQLGDGDIVRVGDAGEVSRPLAADNRLFANETTSLCSPQAWREFRVAFEAIHTSPPALILISTDGYSSSFRSDADFLKVGSDLLDIIRSDGPATVRDHLGEWLSEASRLGSGDDVTLGLLCRTGLHAGLRAGGCEDGTPA